MKVLGITGPIGSGKSTVVRMLVELGMPCYDCDQAAKSLMNSDPRLRERIIAIFGDRAYTDDGLDRAFIADRIFSDVELRKKLEGEVHPAVARDFRSWAACRSSESDWVGLESAILVESGFVDLADQVLFVTAPIAARLDRVSLRDGADREKILRRMAAQTELPQIVGGELNVILNDERELLREKVVAFYEKLTNFVRP